jgi:spore coat protein U-like protein
VRTRHTHKPQFALRCAAACALMTAPAIATPVQGQQTAQSQSEAIVLRPLSFFKVNDLDFGDIIPSNAAGTVTIAPDGSRSRTGGVTLAGNNGAPARFAGLGSFNRQVNISLGSNTIWLTPTAVLSTSPTRFRITSPLGNYNFPVGATLEVGANQAPGVYNGTFTITLNYL